MGKPAAHYVQGPLFNDADKIVSADVLQGLLSEGRYDGAVYITTPEISAEAKEWKDVIRQFSEHARSENLDMTVLFVGTKRRHELGWDDGHPVIVYIHAQEFFAGKGPDFYKVWEAAVHELHEHHQ